MCDPTSITADFRAAIALLVELDEPAAVRVAAALSRWLSGWDFDDAANLPDGWRRALQVELRDAVLTDLLLLFDHIDVPDRAGRIVQGVARAARHRGPRPSGEAGCYFDLFHAGVDLSDRTWRLLIENRGNCNIPIAKPIRQRSIRKSGG